MRPHQRGLILVEGQTEETFVRECLSPHLGAVGLWLDITIVKTKRPAGAPSHKGGVSTFGKIDRDLRRLLGDSNASVITTMIDYHGLPGDFPGMPSRPLGRPRARVEHLQAHWFQIVQDPRFIPFLVLHEFEALLFSDWSAWSAVFPGDGNALQQLKGQLHALAPEEVNERPGFHPSGRIDSALAGRYQKVAQGAQLARRIGLTAMRNRCPHFHEWVTRLEQVARRR